MRVKTLIAATTDKPWRENKTKLLAQQRANISHKEKNTKELYSPIRHVASTATKQKERKDGPGFLPYVC